MVITIEHGVGAGVIIGGALVEGEQCAAGEIGHVVIDEDGDLCSCGRRGCLELTLAAPHLRRRLAAAPGAEHAGILGDAGRALGIALSPVVSVLNLNDVVLAGPPEIIDGPLLDGGALDHPSAERCPPSTTAWMSGSPRRARNWYSSVPRCSCSPPNSGCPER